MNRSSSFCSTPGVYDTPSGSTAFGATPSADNSLADEDEDRAGDLEEDSLDKHSKVFGCLPFSDDDLKPSPIIRKRKKQMVPEEGKDDRYWERRRKNNMAAKRSRDARRAKENQIAIRAAFLERENKALAQELSKARTENHLLRERLCKYEVV